MTGEGNGQVFPERVDDDHFEKMAEEYQMNDQRRTDAYLDGLVEMFDIWDYGSIFHEVPDVPKTAMGADIAGAYAIKSQYANVSGGTQMVELAFDDIHD